MYRSQFFDNTKQILEKKINKVDDKLSYLK